MSLLLVITASSFFFPQFLSLLLDKDTENSLALSYGKALKLEAFFEHQRRNNPVGSFIWLKSTTELIKRHPQYTLVLADFFLQDNQKTKAIFWYEQAIKNDLVKARLTLAQLYFIEKKYLQAELLLPPSIYFNDKKDTEKKLVLLMSIALINGDVVEIERVTKALKFVNEEHVLLAELRRFQVFSLPDFSRDIFPSIRYERIKTKNSINKNCVASMQFFATNLADLRYTDYLIEQIKLRPLSNFSCFEPVRYIPLSTLNCRHKNQEAITCDEALWQSYQQEINSRFIGVMVPQGGAKVHNGIMYLDSADTIDVFAHELAHMYGFIDEYSLPVNHSRCSQVQKKAFAHNIAVLTKTYRGKQLAIRNKILSQLPWGAFIKDETPILTQKDNEWLLGTPERYKSEIGLFPSDTCQKAAFAQSINLQAFKPLAKRTSLHYYELEFPLFYQHLLEENTEAFLMPSFHKNIEKALIH